MLLDQMNLLYRLFQGVTMQNIITLKAQINSEPRNGIARWWATKCYELLCINYLVLAFLCFLYNSVFFLHIEGCAGNVFLIISFA